MDANNACKLTCNDANCDVCSAADTCTTCASGYELDTNNACVARTCNDANCDLCSAADTCTTCASGYELDANNACKLTCNDANCDTCSAVGTCTTCASGYGGENSLLFFKMIISPNLDRLLFLTAMLSRLINSA